MKLPLAIFQTNSTDSIEENIAIVTSWISSAAQHGAQLITMPEVVNLVQKNRTKSLATAQEEINEPFLKACQGLAKQFKIWIHIGSLVVKLPQEERMVNRSYMINDLGQIIAIYDKIHMFDVDLSEGESYRESNSFQPGQKACLVETPWGKIGLTICYDLRFPHLHRHLAENGAQIILNPAAFTQKTGEAHWHALLTARAIENTCFIVAAAQSGQHKDGRETYGHSLVVGPWGDVKLDAQTEIGISYITLDFDEINQTRKMIPSLYNGRQFDSVSSA